MSGESELLAPFVRKYMYSVGSVMHARLAYKQIVQDVVSGVAGAHTSCFLMHSQIDGGLPAGSRDHYAIARGVLIQTSLSSSGISNFSRLSMHIHMPATFANQSASRLFRCCYSILRLNCSCMHPHFTGHDFGNSATIVDSSSEGSDERARRNPGSDRNT